MEHSHKYIKDGILDLRVRLLIFAIGIALLFNLRPFIVQQSFNRANTFLSSGYHQRAIRHFKRTILISPKSVDVHNALGAVYEKLGDYNTALAIYKQSFKNNPDNSRGYLRIGVYYATKKQDCSLAIEWFRKAIEADPKNWYAYTWLSSCYKNLGFDDLVLENYSEMKKVFPQNKKLDGLIKNLESDTVDR